LENQSVEFNEIWKKILINDSINVEKIKIFLDTYGWLGESIIGEKGNKTLFLVIQHADIDTQVHYLPLMRNAVKNGNASPKHLAYLEDRILIRQGEKQIYGTQYAIDFETNEYTVYPILDPENVDKRRAEIGLIPISEYLENCNIEWNLEKHIEENKNSGDKK